jgi:hypothetical protein
MGDSGGLSPRKILPFDHWDVGVEVIEPVPGGWKTEACILLASRDR